MLTKRHLAIIQAALQFFDEEMSPHDPDVSRPYFEEPLERELKADEVEQLRKLLQTVELRYLCREGTGAIVSSQDLLTFEQAQSTPHLLDGRVATVLLISHS